MVANLTERLRSLSIDLSVQNTGCRCFRGSVGKRGYEFWGWQVEGETILPPVSHILLGTVSDSTRAQLINSMTDISQNSSRGVIHHSKDPLSLGAVHNRCNKSSSLHRVISVQFTASLFYSLEISRIA